MRLGSGFPRLRDCPQQLHQHPTGSPFNAPRYGARVAAHAEQNNLRFDFALMFAHGESSQNPPTWQLSREPTGPEIGRGGPSSKGQRRASSRTVKRVNVGGDELPRFGQPHMALSSSRQCPPATSFVVGCSSKRDEGSTGSHLCRQEKLLTKREAETCDEVPCTGRCTEQPVAETSSHGVDNDPS